VHTTTHGQLTFSQVGPEDRNHSDRVVTKGHVSPKATSASHWAKFAENITRFLL
jgi:hypothetical protein